MLSQSKVHSSGGAATAETTLPGTAADSSTAPDAPPRDDPLSESRFSLTKRAERVASLYFCGDAQVTIFMVEYVGRKHQHRWELAIGTGIGWDEAIAMQDISSLVRGLELVLK